MSIIKYKNALKNLLYKRGFWGGVALSSPFYAEFFSWGWAVLLAGPLLLTATLRPKKISIFHLAILPMVLLLLVHVIAIVYSETKFVYQVIKDLFLAVYLIVIYATTHEKTSHGFFMALVPLGIVSAIIGLVKASLLDRGYLLGFLIDACTPYPAGSALCVNYNNLGLIWLVAALGCLKLRLWFFLPILVAAGALSSSRRFLVLVCFLPFVWFMIERKSEAMKLTAKKLVLVGGFSFFLISVVTDPVSFERYRFGGEPFVILGGGNEMYDRISINRSAPVVILGTMGDGTLGAASRLEYWKLAFENISWLPQGWDYHEKFSCEFSQCNEFHYPHLTVLSEWLIGGAFAGFLAILFYIWPVFFVFRQGGGLCFSLIIYSLPYSIISGDTVFSQPLCIASILVALSCVRRIPVKSL